jgi:hypothetical protein
MLLFAIAVSNAALHWKLDHANPSVGRVLALLSLCLWLVVLILGRLTGYTTGAA